MRTPERQRIAQDIINHPDSTVAFEEFNRRHPRKPHRFDLPLHQSTPGELLADELRTTVHNFAHESLLHAAGLSAVQVGVETNMINITNRLLSDPGATPEVRRNRPIAERPYPAPMRTYIERLSGVVAEATRETARTSDPLTYVRVKMNLLHERANQISQHLLKRHYDKMPPVPDRLSRFTPPDAHLFTPEEQQAVLEEKMDPREVIRRVKETGALDQDIVKDQEINGALIAGLVFAGSHAIEQKHPGISPRDTTRLLLYNADVLGLATRPKVANGLYLYLFSEDESARYSFTELVRLATEEQR